MSGGLDGEAAALLGEGFDRLIAAHKAPRRQPGDTAWRVPTPLLWRGMAELGLAGIGVPEAAGGFGGAPVDVGQVMARIGRELLLEPMLSSVVLASGLLAEVGGAVAPPELVEAVAGRICLALAHHEPGQGHARLPLKTQAQAGDRLHGAKSCVLDAPGCGALVVTAQRADGGIGVYLVDAADPGIAWDTYHLVDGRPAADLVLRDVAGRAVGRGDATAALELVLDRAVLAVCSEAVGAMEAVLTLCRDYVKTRRAFGRTLSSFQVLQHRIVDMYVALEEARALLDATLVAWGGEVRSRAAAVAACKVTVARAGRFIGEQGLHLHGGIGMTDEFIASHYYKRLMTLETWFGDAEHHASVFAALCEAGEAA